MTSILSRCSQRPAFKHFTSWAAALLLGMNAALAADAPTPTSPPKASSVQPLKPSDTYKFQAQDTLLIEVVNEPSITAKEFRVSADGEISYPYIGTLKVVGRTPVDVQTEVKKLLEDDYLVSAQVIVQVKEYRKNLVSVIGQVNKPGQVEIPPERKLSVIEAISNAQGYTRLARKGDIEVSRPGQKPLRCSDEEQRNSPEKVIYLEPGDIVYVSESRI